MKLFSYWRSSASWRVRIALGHKGLSYELVTLDIRKEGGQQQRSHEHLLRNPSGQVPALEIAPGRYLGQSLAILEYLEERYPDKPLLPKDPYARAKARQLAEIVNSGIQPFQNLAPAAFLRDESKIDPMPFTRHFITEGLRAMETLAKETAGRFLVGDEPSFADVCLIPQLATSRRHGVAVDEYPILRRAEAAAEAIESWRAAHPDRQPDAPQTP